MKAAKIVGDQRVDSIPGPDLFGQTDQRETMVRDGWTMSNIGKWLTEVKSFETTGAGLLLSLIAVFAIAGFIAGMRWEQKMTDILVVQGKRYQLIGLAQPQGMDHRFFMPIYKEIP